MASVLFPSRSDSAVTLLGKHPERVVNADNAETINGHITTAPPAPSNTTAKSTLEYLMHEPKPRLAKLLATVHTPNNCFIKLHGEWYDVHAFAARHPGGEMALRLGQGRDATALFESYHVFADHAKIESLLDKFRVSKADVARLGLVTLESGLVGGNTTDFYPGEYGDEVGWRFDGAFRKAVVCAVRTYFEGEAKRRGVTLRESTKATFAKWVLIGGTGLLFAGSLRLLVARPTPLRAVLCPVLGWLCGVNVFHDALHFALSTDAALNAVGGALFPFFSSSFAWRHQHVIGHHVHTNLPYRDPDLVHGTEIRREHARHPLAALHRAQAHPLRVAWHFLVGTWLGLGAINDLKLVAFSPSQSYNGFVPRIPVSNAYLVWHFVGRVAYYVTQFGWPFYVLADASFATRLAYSVLPATVFSFLFMLNTQINHLVPSAMQQEDNTGTDRGLDWTVHQVVTAQNFGSFENGGLAWYFHFWFSGALNMQIEHHLFPSVNGCHLPQVSLIVKEKCREFGVRYNCVSGYLEGMKEYLKHSRNMAEIGNSDGDILKEKKD
ncbi:hypothetical protein HK100_003388 [Physocladia obscura]|uniref:Cytochrome b5 heme-binding domain-containing protein n=1 Tax=Physocladia obscura TaxID=109957 RepID=A0AAD5SWR8_9FUNG|nr:hypothetical protein HK100_003388 [Physocladia obscura]